VPGQGPDELIAWCLACSCQEEEGWSGDSPLNGEHLPSLGLWLVKKGSFPLCSCPDGALCSRARPSRGLDVWVRVLRPGACGGRGCLLLSLCLGLTHFLPSQCLWTLPVCCSFWLQSGWWSRLWSLLQKPCHAAQYCSASFLFTQAGC